MGCLTSKRGQNSSERQQILWEEIKQDHLESILNSSQAQESINISIKSQTSNQLIFDIQGNYSLE